MARRRSAQAASVAGWGSHLNVVVGEVEFTQPSEGCETCNLRDLVVAEVKANKPCMAGKVPKKFDVIVAQVRDLDLGSKKPVPRVPHVLPMATRHFEIQHLDAKREANAARCERTLELVR